VADPSPAVDLPDARYTTSSETTAAELGTAFALEDYKAVSSDRGWPSANAITARFGSWNRARDMAGLPLRPQQRGWTRDQLTRALHAAARRLGRTPIAQDWNQLAGELGWPHSATVARRLGYGSWERAIERAGLSRRPRSDWTVEQVIALLRADAYRRGRPPRAHEWLEKDAGRPTCLQVTNMFGSWNAALLQADLETYRPAA